MNSETQPLDDLISRHFDDATSAGEGAVLAAQLAVDSSAALQFVRTARVHALLESFAPPRPAGRAVLLRRWIGLGAAAALVAARAGSAIFLLSKPVTSGVHPQIVLETSEKPADRKPLPPGVNLRTVKNFARATTVPPASLEYLLSNFYVHADPNGLSVVEALHALEKSIGEANLLNRTELNELRFTADTSPLRPVLRPGARNPLPELRFDRKGQGASPFLVIHSRLSPPLTILDYVNVCALRCDITQEPGGVRYSQAPYRRDAADNGNRITQFGTYPVPQGPISLDPPSTRVLEESSRSKLNRLDAFLEFSLIQQTAQHYLTTKYVLCAVELLPAGFEADSGMLLTGPEFQNFCTRLSSAQGVDLATAPAVLVRAGQAAAMEILYDKSDSSPAQPDWFGLRQEMLTTCVGETIQVSGLVDLGLPAASGMVPFSEIIGNEDAFHNYEAENVKHHMTGYDIWVPNGYTAMFTLDVDTGSRGVAVACVTAQVVDPAAQ